MKFCNSTELRISEQQIRRETRGQYNFRAGRVMALKFKESVSTSITNPSISLVKQTTFKQLLQNWDLTMSILHIVFGHQI